jgi:hypothetical protein
MREGLVTFLQLAAHVEDRDAILGLLEKNAAADNLFGESGFGQPPFGDVHDEPMPECGGIGLRHGNGAQLYPGLAFPGIAHAEFMP